MEVAVIGDGINSVMTAWVGSYRKKVIQLPCLKNMN